MPQINDIIDRQKENDIRSPICEYARWCGVKMSKCIGCGRDLSNDDIGATKKFINRGATEFYCIDCLAEHFKVERSFIEEKIEYFRAHGCTLFPKK